MSERPLPPHVTVPLLDRLAQNALDADYQTVAARRAGGPVSRPVHSVRAVLVLVVFGVLVATAFAQNSANAPVSANGRATLISQITRQRSLLADQQASIASLRREVSSLQVAADTIGRQATAATNAVRRLQLPSGYAAGSGPGVRVVVDDSPRGGDSGVVRDSDLVLLVNGFWAAGAEAISINGQRLTPITAIRNSGWAIHVNGHGLARPYVVTVIGDPAQLQARLLDTTTGQLWFALVNQIGFEFTMDSVKNLSVPATPLPTLRSARQLTQPTGPATASNSEGGRK